MMVCSSSMNRMTLPSFFTSSMADFDTLFKIAAVLGACDHTGQIKSHQTLAFQQLRHLACMNLQRQAFRNGGFADARFTDEHRVILRAARQDLDDTFNLGTDGR